MVIPSKDIMEKFINSISKLFILNDNLQLKNQNLLKTRDLLLPRLISGEMDVSELNIKLPEIEV
jgi:type I restriction enzyme S subunit